MKFLKSTAALLFALLLTAAFSAAAAEGADSSAAVRVKAFLDGNGNGECGPYEKEYAGVTVKLVREDDSIYGEEVTGEDGIASFTDLEPGTYRIRAELPDGMIFSKKGRKTGIDGSCTGLSAEGTQDSDPFEVGAGETYETGISVQTGVYVSGTCWIDENGDGIMDDDEPRASGVQITMEGQKNGLSYETRSGENGEWKIERVRPGFYDLTAYAPEGMMFTRYSKTGGKNRSIFTAEGKSKATKKLDTNNGEPATDQNIGFTTEASVSGICFLDANYNGLYDEGEKPMAGVKVTAIKQLKDEEVAVTYSGEDGRYTLSGLRSNTYKIRVVLPDDGCNFSKVTDDPLGNHFEARPSRRENFWNDFVVEDGKKHTVNVGVIYYGSVSGTVYLDDDFSAALNGKEKVVQGVAVTLVDAAGETVDFRKSNNKGTYTFTGLVPGEYSLRMTAKKGYAFTRLGEGNVMLNLNNGEGYSEPFAVALGEEVTGCDAGMIEPGTVEGTVFADLNDNGVQDEGEGGLKGTVVKLMGDGEAFFTAEIGEDGHFLFDAVMPGTYTVRYELPEHSVFAAVTGGGNEIAGEDGIGETEAFSFATADYHKAPLCGALTLGRISGTVYRDHDGSGEQKEDEEKMPGTEISLIPAREDLETVTVVTENDGAFLLDNIRPGDYTLKLNIPEDLVLSRTKGTSLPLTAGLNEQSPALTVSMGDLLDEQSLGVVLPARISGSAWLDENNNGIREEDEKALAGAQVIVRDELDGSVFTELTTEEDGSFRAEGMIPGSFAVEYEMDSQTESAQEGDSTFTENGRKLEMTGIALTEGEARDDLLLGVVRYTSMGGSVWVDRSGEVASLADVHVVLTNENGESLQSAVTGEDGGYLFEGLMPGNYRILAELPEGYVAVEPDDERLTEGMISIMDETDGRTGFSGLISLLMGEDMLQMNIGGVLPGTIGDYCWLDDNGNGWQDGSEYGIPGVKIELVRNGQVAAETVTDQYGLYWFREVYPAVYTLRITPPVEVKPTQKRTDIPLIVSSVNETEEGICYTDEIAVQSDVINYNVDLGFVCRNPGAYPPGYGQGKKMNWSLTYAPEEE